MEVLPSRRVVISWGWEAEGAAVPSGASLVEIELTPDGDGTRLWLRHSGLPGDEATSHAEGWDHFLPRLADAVGNSVVSAG